MLKRLLIFAGLIGTIVLLFKFCDFKKSDDSTSIDGAGLIQQQILNVGKLIVTEGHFSEVITYKNQEKYLMGIVSFDKKALVVVNADVTVAYDLHQMKYDIDEANKTISILYIPKEEIKISPDIKFYDVEQSKLNPFTGDDYNKINASVKASLAKKIQKSTLKSNAQNRLISELSQLLITTKNLGWVLKYDGKVIQSDSELGKQIKL
jgi:lipopolysaccharide export LptBFGC system permease protein LptF